MTHLTLERHQVWIYLVAIIFGLGLGMAAPSAAPLITTLLWPVLALLLFVTFVQVPLWHLPAVFRDHRFIAAVLIGNFMLVPLLVALMIRWLPDDPALRLGVLLVLLAPCTDWFITFTRLGGGDTFSFTWITGWPASLGRRYNRARLGLLKHGHHRRSLAFDRRPLLSLGDEYSAWIAEYSTHALLQLIQTQFNIYKYQRVILLLGSA